MLLILTNTEDVTADYLVSVLKRCSVNLIRFDTDTMLDRIRFSYAGCKPVIHVDGVFCHPAEVSNVWYRRPERVKRNGLVDLAEGKFILDEWSEVLEGFFAHVEKPRWMNHPACNVAASHKIDQLTKAKEFGLRVPETLVTQSAQELRFFNEKHGGLIIVKPMAGGSVERENGERESLVYTNRVPLDHLADLGDLAACPTLFQELIDKEADVRITVVDRDVHAVELIAKEPDGSQRCDIRRNNMDDVKYRVVRVPGAVETGIRRLLTYYGLRFAAIDMAVTRTGDWVFFEVNPNGQWAWLDLAGATNIADSFVTAFRQE